MQDFNTISVGLIFDYFLWEGCNHRNPTAPPPYSLNHNGARKISIQDVKNAIHFVKNIAENQMPTPPIEIGLKYKLI